MAAHTYICKSCDPVRPCVCPDATDKPTRCSIISGKDISKWVIDDTVITARKFEGVRRDG